MWMDQEDLPWGYDERVVMRTHREQSKPGSTWLETRQP